MAHNMCHTAAGAEGRSDGKPVKEVVEGIPHKNVDYYRRHQSHAESPSHTSLFYVHSVTVMSVTVTVTVTVTFFSVCVRCRSVTHSSRQSRDNAASVAMCMRMFKVVCPSGHSRI